MPPPVDARPLNASQIFARKIRRLLGKGLASRIVGSSIEVATAHRRPSGILEILLSLDRALLAERVGRYTRGTF
jgi:hypothetical protein